MEELLADGPEGEGFSAGAAVESDPAAGAAPSGAADGGARVPRLAGHSAAIGAVAGKGVGSEGALAESAIVPLAPRKLGSELDSAAVAGLAAVKAPSAAELLMAPCIRAIQERCAAEGPETSSVFYGVWFGRLDSLAALTC